MNAARTWIAPVGAAVVLGLVAAWFNLHTDEVTVVLALLLVFAGVLGAAKPAGTLLWPLAIGGSVPLSQYAAWRFGWRTPYPNTPPALWESSIAIVPALVAAGLGAGLRLIMGPAAQHAGRNVPPRAWPRVRRRKIWARGCPGARARARRTANDSQEPAQPRG